MFKCYTGSIYRSSVEKDRQSEMSCSLSFIVIILFTAGTQIGMLAIFSMAPSFPFPVQANAVFCTLSITALLTGPVPFLFTGMRGTLTSFAILSMLILRLKNNHHHTQ